MSLNKEKIAVIDIGSNSIRLVIFDRFARYPYSLFNERVTCKLGMNLDSTGILEQKNIELSLNTLRRFSKIINNIKPDNLIVIGTAALRRASNSSDFLIHAEKILNYQIRILSGEEEAKLVANGLMANIPKANGIIGDLGGGSFELIKVEAGIIKDLKSFDFGHLNEIDIKLIKNAFKELNWNNDGSQNFFYGVGGSFRALGTIFKSKNKYPIEPLHGLIMPIRPTKNLIKKIISSEGSTKYLPSYRRESMPNAVKIINEVLKYTNSKQIYVSGTSVRDGVVLESLKQSLKKEDPLIVTSKQIAKEKVRFRGLSTSLFDLLKPFKAYFKDKEMERLIKSICLLADISWDEHPSSRAILALEKILYLPINSVTHDERAWLAMAIYHRYARQMQIQKMPYNFSSILSKKRRNSSIIIGLALKFLMTFCAGIPKLLKNIKIKIKDDHLIVEFKNSSNDLYADHLKNRLENLASVMNKNLKIKI